MAKLPDSVDIDVTTHWNECRCEQDAEWLRVLKDIKAVLWGILVALVGDIVAHVSAWWW